MAQRRRPGRLSELMQQELSDILRKQVKDPRVAEFCTIMRVDVSDDLRYAKVLVSIMGDESQQKSTMIGLKNATGFIRREIGHRIGLRFTPELSFIIDNSVEYSFKIDKLIRDFRENNNISDDQEL
ncbi:TPA: 30S ribosome-binding factor RbfA [bacterium]|nr:30S ribosome-binding factor RbfA [bacterium]